MIIGSFSTEQHMKTFSCDMKILEFWNVKLLLFSSFFFGGAWKVINFLRGIDQKGDDFFLGKGGHTLVLTLI